MRIDERLKFVVLLGLVSLFGDVVYEGARSITGPYLASLGASAATVGFISGFAEFLGYALRVLSGRLADRNGKPWGTIGFGYCLNLLSVPLLAFTHTWPAAAALVFAERTGKAIRTPARDMVLADATSDMGRGHGFGLHQTLDQIGAISGPVLVFFCLSGTHQYSTSFGILFAPALIALAVLLVARQNAPAPRHTDAAGTPDTKLSRTFWLYTVAMTCVAIGFVDFPLIAYHLYKHVGVPAATIPLFYAAAMAIEMIVAFPLGKLFDKYGTIVLATVTAIGACAVPLAFANTAWVTFLGIALWGVAIASQNSIVKAKIAEIVPSSHHGRAFGLFGTVYGIGWFVGSTALGLLYDWNITAMVALSLGAQLLALPILQRLLHQTDPNP